MNCETVTDGAGTLEPWNFTIAYDKLVIAAGAEASTFGIRGVKEHAIFLREVHHAQEIRRKLLLNLMISDVPGIRYAALYPTFCSHLNELALFWTLFADTVPVRQELVMKRNVGSYIV